MKTLPTSLLFSWVANSVPGDHRTCSCSVESLLLFVWWLLLACLAGCSTDLGLASRELPLLGSSLDESAVLALGFEFSGFSEIKYQCLVINIIYSDHYHSCFQHFNTVILCRKSQFRILISFLRMCYHLEIKPRSNWHTRKSPSMRLSAL